MRRMHVSCITCILALSTAEFVNAETGMHDGQPLPDFFFPSLETGKLERLSSFRGRKTLLLVYASW